MAPSLQESSVHANSDAPQTPAKVFPKLKSLQIRESLLAAEVWTTRAFAGCGSLGCEGFCWVRKFRLRGLEQDRACRAVPAIVSWELGCERVQGQDGVCVGGPERPPERQAEHHKRHAHPGVAANNPVPDEGEDCCIEGGGATLQGFAGWRIVSGRTRRFAVNGTGQATRRNSARVHYKAEKEAVIGLAVALQHNVCGGASSPHT
jgi:hypothetical protein